MSDDNAAGQSSTTKPSPWRSLSVGVLIVIGCALIALGSIAVWLEYTLLETDEYVDTVAPLTSEPAVAEALSAFIVEEVVRETNAEAELEMALRENLGPEAANFSGIIASSVSTGAENVVSDLIASEEFEALWEEANRAAHSEALAAIKNEDSALVESEGVVELDLKPVVERVVEQLAGETDLQISVPEDVGRVELFEDKGQLKEVQDAANVLEALSWVLLVVALIVFVLAIWLSRGRWRSVMQIGFGLIIVALLTTVILRFVRSLTIDQVADPDLPDEAVAAIWDTLIRNLETQNWVLLLAGVAAVTVGAVMGDYDWARSLRQSLSEQVDESGTESALQRFARERTDLMRGIGVAVGILLLLIWPDPGILVAFVIIALVVLYLIGVQYLKKEPQ
jgi:hypothetical protein